MALFHVVDDAFVILRSKGVYRQAKVFKRGDGVYAGCGAGFIRLMRHQNGTSVPTVSWDEIVAPFEPAFDQLGRMITKEAE